MQFMPEDKQLESFLYDLTELSRRYKIGITGDMEPFVMEKDDSALAYTCNADGKLVHILD